MQNPGQKIDQFETANFYSDMEKMRKNESSSGRLSFMRIKAMENYEIKMTGSNNIQNEKSKTLKNAHRI